MPSIYLALGILAHLLRMLMEPINTMLIGHTNHSLRI